MAKKNEPVRARAALEKLVGPLTFGSHVRAIREGEGESLAEFAAELGVSRQHLSDVEHDRRGVSVERAAAWAEVLGYHAGQFIQLALDAQIRAAKLPFVVKVESRPGGKRRAA